MIKTHFYDLLRKINIEPSEELKRLNKLFSNEGIIPGFYNYGTLEEYINEHAFKKLNSNLRGTCTSIKELREMLEITEYQFENTFDCLILFSEFLYAVISESYNIIKNREEAVNQANTILSNIDAILEKANHEWFMRPNGDRIIVEKNKLTTQAVEIIDEDDTAIKAIEYNHYALKGDLVKKRAILVALGSYIEPLLLSKKLERNGFSNLQSDVGFVLNKFNIRHNNKEGKNAKVYTVQLGEKELEEWYDKAYNMILTALITAEHIDITNELSQLKSEYRW